MSRLLPVLLIRVATLVVASLLLFAVFGKTKAQGAQDRDYGFQRIAGAAATIQ